MFSYQLVIAGLFEARGRRERLTEEAFASALAVLRARQPYTRVVLGPDKHSFEGARGDRIPLRVVRVASAGAVGKCAREVVAQVRDLHASLIDVVLIEYDDQQAVADDTYTCSFLVYAHHGIADARSILIAGSALVDPTAATPLPTTPVDWFAALPTEEEMPPPPPIDAVSLHSECDRVLGLPTSSDEPPPFPAQHVWEYLRVTLSAAETQKLTEATHAHGSSVWSAVQVAAAHAQLWLNERNAKADANDSASETVDCVASCVVDTRQFVGLPQDFFATPGTQAIVPFALHRNASEFFWHDSTKLRESLKAEVASKRPLASLREMTLSYPNGLYLTNNYGDMTRMGLSCASADKQVSLQSFRILTHVPPSPGTATIVHSMNGQLTLTHPYVPYFWHRDTIRQFHEKVIGALRSAL